MNKISLLLTLCIVALLSVIGFLVYDKVLYAPSTSPIVVVDNGETPEPVACTMEAKLCPDGSYVGRTGPACEFAACPATQAGENKIPWSIYIGTKSAKSLLYTDKLATIYIEIASAPTIITISSTTPYACNFAGSDESLMVNAKTEEHKIGRYTYCVTTQSEGAAGSTFTTYNYVVAYHTGTVAFDFTVRYTQCANYNETERKACEASRAIFSIDRFVDQIFTRFYWNAFGLE